MQFPQQRVPCLKFRSVCVIQQHECTVSQRYSARRLGRPANAQSGTSLYKVVAVRSTDRHVVIVVSLLLGDRTRLWRQRAHERDVASIFVVQFRRVADARRRLYVE